MVVKILKWIWQLPQHLIAVLFWIYLKISKKIVGYTKGDPYIISVKGIGGSVTFGMYIFLSYSASDKTRKHETGHSIQSLYLGPLYFIVIGIPSLIWAGLHGTVIKDKPYNWSYTEKWADRLGGV